MQDMPKKSRDGYIDIKASLIFIVNSDEIFLRRLEKKLCILPRTKIRTFISIEECLKQIHNNPSLILIVNNKDKSEVEKIIKIVNQDYPKTNIIFQ